jgi:hypothetical protein
MRSDIRQALESIALAMDRLKAVQATLETAAPDVPPVVPQSVLDVKRFTAVGFSPDATGASFNWGFMQGKGSCLEARVNAPKDGLCDLALSYACMAEIDVMVLVDGLWHGSLKLPATGQWFDVYRTVLAEVALPKGECTIRIEAASDVFFNISGVALSMPGVTLVGSAPEVPPVVEPPPVPPVTEPSGQGPAFDFVKSLKCGINVERARAWYMGDFGSGTQSYSYFKSMGMTHVRLFYPWRPSINMGGSATGQLPKASEFQRIIESARNAQKAGLKVFLDCCDVMEISEMGSDTDKYLEMAAGQIAISGLDKSMIAVGAVNEFAGADNNKWNPHRKRVNALMRKALPGWLLTTGSAYWKHYAYLIAADFELSNDALMIYDTHQYDWNASEPGHWTLVAGDLNSFSARHDVPVVMGEAGLGWDNGGLDHVGEWAPILSSLLASQIPAPTLWAITDGSEWRLNVDNGWKLRLGLEAVVRAAK